jgi:hypothetical protein
MSKLTDGYYEFRFDETYPVKYLSGKSKVFVVKEGLQCSLLTLMRQQQAAEWYPTANVTEPGIMIVPLSKDEAFLLVEQFIQDSFNRHFARFEQIVAEEVNTTES